MLKPTRCSHHWLAAVALLLLLPAQAHCDEPAAASSLGAFDALTARGERARRGELREEKGGAQLILHESAALPFEPDERPTLQVPLAPRRGAACEASLPAADADNPLVWWVFSGETAPIALSLGLDGPPTLWRHKVQKKKACFERWTLPEPFWCNEGALPPKIKTLLELNFDVEDEAPSLKPLMLLVEVEDNKVIPINVEVGFQVPGALEITPGLDSPISESILFSDQLEGEGTVSIHQTPEGMVLLKITEENHQVAVDRTGAGGGTTFERVQVLVWSPTLHAFKPLYLQRTSKELDFSDFENGDSTSTETLCNYPLGQSDPMPVLSLQQHSRVDEDETMTRRCPETDTPKAVEEDDGDEDELTPPCPIVCTRTEHHDERRASWTLDLDDVTFLLVDHPRVSHDASNREGESCPE